jgi:hypothetical protein
MSKKSSQASPAAGELDLSPSHDLNLEKAKQHDAERSLIRSIFIVITCTAAMVVNVCSPFTSLISPF